MIDNLCLTRIPITFSRGCTTCSKLWISPSYGSWHLNKLSFMIIGKDGNGKIKLRKSKLVTEWAVIVKEGTVIGNRWYNNRKLLQRGQ